MGKPLNSLMWLVRSSVMVMILIGLLGLWRTGEQWNQRLSSITAWFQAPQPEPEVDARTLILQQVRGVSELTTAVLSMESVVPTHLDRTLGTYVIGTTRLLYIAHGEVRAGLDLSQLTQDNITIQGDTVQIQLPPPVILDRKIDVERSQIYDYDRGFLGLGPHAAAELQTLAQRETLDDLVDAACDHQLLEQANERAITVLSQLLETTQTYSSVSIQTQSPSPDACPISFDQPLGNTQ
ncbi:MAG: DUF4230 domain-containing protein [Cyanobacteria bacterium P01_F01_bin.150]